MPRKKTVRKQEPDNNALMEQGFDLVMTTLLLVLETQRLIIKKLNDKKIIW